MADLPVFNSLWAQETHAPSLKCHDAHLKVRYSLQGLAFPQLANEAGGNPPFWNMVNNKQLDANQFSVWLNPNETALNAGEVVFGGINSNRYTGTLNM